MSVSLHFRHAAEITKFGCPMCEPPQWYQTVYNYEVQFKKNHAECFKPGPKPTKKTPSPIKTFKHAVDNPAVAKKSIRCFP